jgi:hypothetical protein
MADNKSTVLKGGLNIAKRLLADSDEALTASQRAEAGKKASQLIASQPQIKASEALGQLMEKGVKRTTTTQADRTRVGGGNIGGASFPAISQADPNYAGKVWGVMDEGTAARLKNLTDPDTAWTTMLGSANQLKTNPIVFDKLKRQFLASMKQGNLSDELANKINHNLALTFGEGADIRDPKIWRQADTFDKRAVLADMMMGQGIAPSKGGVAIGGEKSGKGVIFRPTDTLIKETEPYLLHPEHGGDVPTFAAGPRLFRLEKESVNRPDLHPGFPTLIHGEDYGINMLPTPTEVYLPDWHKRFKANNPDRKGPGYYDLALGVKGEGLPSQDLNDEYIRHLLREGFKEGGEVDIEAADKRLADAMAKRMAGGGGAFKRLEFTEEDSPVQMGIHASKMGENQNAGVMANLDMKGAGRLGVGSNMSSRGSEMHPSTMVNYSNNVGDLGINANVMKPTDSHNDMLMTNVMASYPVGSGHLTAGMHGSRMDGTHRINAHSLGFNAPLGGGNLNINVNKPVEGKPMIGAQYTRSFADGGDVPHMADAGRVVKGLGQLGKRLLSEEQVAGQAIGKAAESAGMKAPVTANKPLTDVQDFHTSLMDSVRARAMDAQKQMDSWNYKYEPGQYVFTEHGAKNNLPPLKILEKSRHGWNIVREDPNNPLSKKVIDPITGKAQRTPYEPGYRVRREFGPEDWSEFVIPESAIKGDVEMAMGGLAHMAPGGLLKGMAKVGKRLVADPTESALMSVRRGERMADEMGGNNIMKDVGGNWMSGNVEKAVSPLRQKLDAPKSLASTASYDPSENLAKIEKIWTPELIAEKEKHLPRIRTAVEEAKAELRPKAALNDWVDRNLTNYIKKQMATQNDPIRLLGEEGITHLPPNTRMPPNMRDVELHREAAGFPQPVGKSPLAQTWEAWADKPIGFDTVGELINKGKGEPWMEKADKLTNVHRISPNYERHMFTDLGFDHIVDVLKADLASGRIRPEQLNKVSIEDAVRRTHQYNEEMAKKMRETQIKATEGMPTHKEYPEGYKWIELTKPQDLPKGHTERMGVVHDENGNVVGRVGSPNDPRHQALENALKYEGDTMGHCVGNYCEDVAHGHSRIYSLRDAKGEPHVTIEVQPDQDILGFRNAKENYPELYAKYSADKNKYSNSWRDFLRQEAPEVLENVPKKIVQIKGKQNKAPNEEYVPFVQDFVRGGDWSEVGDIGNTGLKPLTHINEDAINKIGLKLPKYVTEQESKDLNDFIYNYRPEHGLPNEVPLPESIQKFRMQQNPPVEGMANGGSAFKTIDWEPHFDGGGIASQEFVDPFADARKEPLFTKKDVEKKINNIKRNAPEIYDMAKQELQDEYNQLRTLGGAKDFALRTGAQFAGGIPDLANLGLMGVDALADTNLSSEKPWFGSEQYIDAMRKAGMLGEHEFPIAEIGAGFLSPAALAKKGVKLYKVAKATKELPKKQSGGLTAMKH